MKISISKAFTCSSVLSESDATSLRSPAQHKQEWLTVKEMKVFNEGNDKYIVGCASLTLASMGTSAPDAADFQLPTESLSQ